MITRHGSKCNDTGRCAENGGGRRVVVMVNDKGLIVVKVSRLRGCEASGMGRCLKVFLLFLALLFVGSCGFTTDSTGPKAVLPPTAVHVDEVPQGVRLKWSAVRDASIYTVFWGTSPTDYKNLANVKDCSVIISGLAKGELYCFAVTSWGERGESDYSSEVDYVYDDDPSRSSQHLAKGNELMANGLYPEAHAYISAAIRLQPKRVDAYKSRALLYEKMDEPALAKKDRVMAEKLSSRKTALLDLKRR